MGGGKGIAGKLLGRKRQRRGKRGRKREDGVLTPKKKSSRGEGGTPALRTAPAKKSEGRGRAANLVS